MNKLMDKITTDQQTRRWIWIGLLVVAVLIVVLGGWALWRQPQATATPISAAPDKTRSTGTSTSTQPPSSEATDTPARVVTYTPTIAFVATVIAEDVDVHNGPGYQYPVVTTIDEAIQVRVLGRNQSKTWLLILMPDNQQGWIPSEAVEFDFNIDLLPIVKETPLPPTPYGSSMLVPPQLLGVSPASPSSSARSGLSVTAIILLMAVTLTASGGSLRRNRKLIPQHLLQYLISLL